MGCYGLGISRLLAAGIEVLSLDKEIRWPKRLAPYQVCIISPKHGSKEESVTTLAGQICDVLSESFVNDVVMDDRTKMTIGERLKLAMRIGYPHVIVVGKKALESTPLLEVFDIYADKCELMTYDDLLLHFHEVRKNST